MWRTNSATCSRSSPRGDQDECAVTTRGCRIRFRPGRGGPDPVSPRDRTRASSWPAIVRHPLRWFETSSKVMAGPNFKVIGPGRGPVRFAGHASWAPSIHTGTTGMRDSATRAPIPALNPAISPLRLRVPSGKSTRIGPWSPSSRVRSALSAFPPHPPRHTGRAFSSSDARPARRRDRKKVSPAASRVTSVEWRGATEAPSERASRWELWLATRTNGPVVGRWWRPDAVKSCARRR